MASTNLRALLRAVSVVQWVIWGALTASIPFYAVFPASTPEKPITLDGVFTSPEPIIQALSQAVPARHDPGLVRTETRQSKPGI